MKASLYIYSTPKCSANMVNVSTKDADTKASPSTQNTKCESTKSKQ